uniref:activating signal cointegrator 1 complex subunit 2 homolog n=1 Tax=Semicossyphus pulcher TaxID=241346 RepID=UPI0037E8A170
MKAPSAAGTSAYYGQGGYASAVKTSSLFSPRAPSSQKNSDTQMQTSATAPARRVPLHRSSKQSKLSSFSSSPKTFRTEAAKPNQSKLFSVAGGNAQGSYKSTSRYSMPSSHVSYSQPLSVSNELNALFSFQPRSPQMPTSQRFRSTEQNPSSTSSLQNPAQGAHNQPASGSGGTPRYAPTRTHSIPERFGGFAIRRLKDPDDQKEAGNRHPQQTYTAPSAQSGSYKPQVQSIRKTQQTYTAPSEQTASYQPQVQNIRKPQQTYTAPSVQIVSYKPQVQSIRKPQQTYTAPSAQILSYKPQQTYTASSAQSVSYKPQVQNTRKPQQAYTAPSEQTASYQPQVQNIRKPQQTYPAPSAQTVSHTPQVQSVHQESKWKRVRPRWGQ